MKTLSEFIKESIEHYQLTEGVTRAGESFTFDYEHDGKDDIIHLTNDSVHLRSFQDIEYFYYAYDFNPETDSVTRAAFIHDLKFNESTEWAREREKFVHTAINRLSRAVNLRSYNIILKPETRSPLLQTMQSYLYRMIRPTYSFSTIELTKELPANIEFDYKLFKDDWLDSMVNNRPRYTEPQKHQVLNNISKMMDMIHSLDYFSIARNVKKNIYRKYIKNYLKFKNDDDKDLFEGLREAKILIIDDISTSGSTIEQILKSIETVRQPDKHNDITLFTIISHTE